MEAFRRRVPGKHFDQAVILIKHHKTGQFQQKPKAKSPSPKISNIVLSDLKAGRVCDSCDKQGKHIDAETLAQGHRYRASQ